MAATAADGNSVAAGGPPVPPHGFTAASSTPMTTIEPINAPWPLNGERGGRTGWSSAIAGGYG